MPGVVDVRGRYVSPAASETAFNCPHCGAYAKQLWYSGAADRLTRDGVPDIVTDDRLKAVPLEGLNEHGRAKVTRWLEQMASGRPFLEHERNDVTSKLWNVSISSCFNCDDLCIWVYDQLLWPKRLGGPQPNADLSAEVRRDYEEAGSILDASPRGAAALLRLAIQKLCKELGEGGNNINDDIAALVKKGLDPRVQRALDVVRVVGNNAVHPGQIDLKDDRATAEELFGLVNLIAEIMITQPKHVEAIYNKLPEAARQAIEKRDGPKQ